jgi:prevent-host-death family protein
MGKKDLPKYVSKGVLKSRMLEYLREVERTGKELIITDHRKPVLKIVPLERKPKSTESIFKPYRQRIIYREDITTPTIDEWTEV